MAGKNIDVNIDINADSSQATAELHKASKAVDDLGESSVAASKRYEAAQAETQQQLKKTAKTATETGEAQEEASEKAQKAALKAAQEAEREWNNAYSKMKNGILSWGESVNSTILHIGGNVLRKGLNMAVDGVKNLASQGYELQSELEGVKVALETMSTAGADADTVLKQIQKDAIITPFDVSSLSKATQRFTMITGNAEEAEKTVLNFGKALAAAGKGSVEITRVATNMQQIGNQARISQKDFNEFATAGINMTKLVAEYAGIAENEVMDYLKAWQTGVDKGMTEAQLLAKGVQKPYDILVGAINKATSAGGVFENVYRDMAGTLPQMVNNMQETIAMGVATIFADSGLEDELKGMMQAISNAIVDSDIIESASVALGHLVDVFKEFVGVGSGAELIQKVFGAVTNFLRDLASGKYDATIKNIFQAIKTFFQTQWNLNPLLVGMRLLIQLLNALPEGAGNVIGGIASAVVGLGSAIGIWSKVSGPLKSIGNLIDKFKKHKNAGKVVEDVATKVSSGGKILSTTIEKVQSVFSKAATIIKKAVTGIVDGVKFLADSVVTLISNLLNSATTLLQNGFTAVANVVNSLLTNLTSILETAIQSLGTLGNALVDALGRILTTASSHLANIMGNLGEGVAKFLSAISDPQLLVGVVTLAGIGFSLGIFADSLAKFNQVSWEDLAKGAVVLVAFGGAAAIAGKNISTLVKGFVGLAALAAGIAVVGVALGSFAENVAKFSAVSWGDLAKAAVVLVALTAAMVGLSAIVIPVAIGAAALLAASIGIAAFGASLIAVGAGLKALGEASQMEANLWGLLGLVGSAVAVGAAMAAAAPIMAAAAVSGVSMMVMATSLSGAVAAVNAIPQLTRDLGDVLGLIVQLDLIAVAMAAGGVASLMGALSGLGLLAIATELLGIANAINAIPQVDSSKIESIQPALDALGEMAETLSKGLIDNLLGAISGGALLAVANEVKNIAFALSEIPTIDTGPMELLVPAINKLHDISEALSGKIMENLKAMFSGGALLVVANEVKSIACALSETPVVNTQGIESIQGTVGKLQEISSSLAEHAFDNLLGAGSGAGLLVVANEIKSIAYALNETPVIDPKGIESIEANIGRLQALSDRLAGNIFSNLFGAASGAGLLAVANEIKSVAYAMNEAGQQLAGVDLSQFDKLDSIADICQRIGDLTDYIPVEKTQRIRDMFDALGDAFDNEVGEKVYQAVKMLQKTNWATFATDMQHLTDALNQDYPDLGNFVNFFDRIGDALDNGVVDNMGRLIDTFMKNDKAKMELATTNAEEFVKFVQGTDGTKNWNATTADKFRQFFDNVGNALDMDVVPNMEKLLDVFNKFSKDKIAVVVSNAKAFVDFIQGENVSWDSSTAEKFKEFFDQVGWALDNDVAPNIQKLLDVFNNFSKDKMAVVLANASSFVEFVQGEGLPDKSKNWNADCANNFMNFFDRVGWALDNEVAPNIGKLLEVFAKFSEDQLTTVKTNAQNFVDFINGDLFANNPNGTWSLDNVTNFMNFFDQVGWALDNGVVQAIDSLLNVFGRDPEAMQTAITNAGNFIKFIDGTADGMGEGGWNVEKAINFMNYFDRLGDALDKDILATVELLFKTFSVEHGEILETAKQLSLLVGGNNGAYAWDYTAAELFVGYMNKLSEYAVTPETVKQIIDGFTGVDTTGATATANALAEIIRSISDAFSNYEPNMYENGSRLGVQFRNGWFSQHEYIKSTALASGTAMNDALNTFNGMGGPLWSTANEMTHWIARPFLDYDWASHGRQAADGIINGVRSRSSSAFYAGYDLAQRIVAGIRAGGQEGSPWKLSYQSGVFAARGLINGAKDMVGDVKDMGEEIANALMTGYNDTFETLQADVSVSDALGEASALGERQAITNNKNVHITNNNTVNSELDMALVNSRINWEIAHAL